MKSFGCFTQQFSLSGSRLEILRDKMPVGWPSNVQEGNGLNLTESFPVHICTLWASTQSRCLVLFSFGSSGYQLGCTVTAVSGQRQIKHVKNVLHTITTEWPPPSVTFKKSVKHCHTLILRYQQNPWNASTCRGCMFLSRSTLSHWSSATPPLRDFSPFSAKSQNYFLPLISITASLP